ncbi:hypothetical protein BRARA_H00735 [Brassica rapa]|uniref:Ubiquitin-like protease family profile domain-containing protein n=1 Tax=Brassica campestris TaxID=3711 RepID=A0A397YH12_BRACM|nr:hypothetical protein BRARA_H00735 [Brassica rapa]
MDAVMFIWRVNTTLNRWAPSRIAFMSVMFYLQLDAAYNKFLPNKKSYQLPIFFWGNHWIGVCVNIIERKVEVFDCGRRMNRKYVENFTAMIPRIVKAVGPPERQKQQLLSSYSIVDVPMNAYALKHLECSLLGLDLSLVDDEIIMDF